MPGVLPTPLLTSTGGGVTLLYAYNFDEASGNIIDQSGNGRDTVFGGSLSRSASGHTSKGISQTSAAADSAGPSITGLQTANCTLMGWVFRTDNTVIGWFGEIKSSGSGNRGILLGLSGNVGFRCRNSGGTAQTPSVTQPAINGWWHVAGTWDGANVKLFINGVQVASTALTGAPHTSGTGSHLMDTLGAETIVDDVRYYDTALDAATITTLMGTPVSGGGTTPVTATRATTWRVSAQVTGSRVVTWDALAAVTASRVVSWDTLARVTNSRVVSWDVLAAVSSTRATTWRVVARVTGSRATAWDVLSPVSSTRATTWRVRAQVSSTRATTWAVASTLASVTATRATTWKVAARVTSTRVVVWDTRTVVTSSRVATWDVLTRTTGTRAATWRVLAKPSSTRSTVWRVMATLATSRATTWEVRSDIQPRDLTLAGVLEPDRLGAAVDSGRWKVELEPDRLTADVDPDRWRTGIEPNRWEGTVPWPES